MLQTSLLRMKSLNKTETPIFLPVGCSLFPKAIFLTFTLFSYINPANRALGSKLATTRRSLAPMDLKWKKSRNFLL